jgi:hypothetical protein
MSRSVQALPNQFSKRELRDRIRGPARDTTTQSTLTNTTHKFNWQKKCSHASSVTVIFSRKACQSALSIAWWLLRSSIIVRMAYFVLEQAPSGTRSIALGRTSNALGEGVGGAVSVSSETIKYEEGKTKYVWEQAKKLPREAARISYSSVSRWPND